MSKDEFIENLNLDDFIIQENGDEWYMYFKEYMYFRIVFKDMTDHDFVYQIESSKEREKEHCILDELTDEDFDLIIKNIMYKLIK